MRTRRFAPSLLAALLAVLAAPALAESNTLTGNPGFFRPTPDGDPALRAIPPAPATPAPPATPATSPAGAPLGRARPAAGATTVDPAQAAAVVQREQVVRNVESDIERVEREHERAAEKPAQAPTTIQGAFTGLTSERDR